MNEFVSGATMMGLGVIAMFFVRYFRHTGDRLFDGIVRAVNAEGLVIVQEVNDPLSLVKQREVSKKLRSLEAKE